MSHNSVPLATTLRNAAIAIAVVLLMTATICAAFNKHVLTTWVAFFFIAATPAEIVLALLWKSQYPRAIARLPQPARGFVFTIATAVAGLVIGALLFRFAGASIGPPTPMVMMLTMLGVVTIMWWITIWHGWPLTALTTNQLVLGLAILLAAHASALLIFKVGFNFAFLERTPLYVTALDPKGWLDAWTALSVLVTTVAGIMVGLQFDFWPLSRLLRSRAQPVFGLVTTLYVLIVSALMYWVFTRIVGLDPVQHLVRVAVSLIYGVFLVDLMTRHQLFAAWGQPQRGMAVIGIAALLAALIYPLYAQAAFLITGAALASGPPTYELEIWVSTAMLGITFPIMVVVADFFDFWPAHTQPSA